MFVWQSSLSGANLMLTGQLNWELWIVRLTHIAFFTIKHIWSVVICVHNGPLMSWLLSCSNCYYRFHGKKWNSKLRHSICKVKLYSVPFIVFFISSSQKSECECQVQCKAKSNEQSNLQKSIICNELDMCTTAINRINTNVKDKRDD
jgi:hypothetical protein